MRAYLLLLLLLLFGPAYGAEHKVFNYEGSRFTFKLFVTRNIFSDRYEYICGIDSIITTDKTTGVHQTIKCETNGYNCRDTTIPFFRIEDMNFDGIEDMRIMQYLPQGPDIPYYYWVYNAKTKKFEQDKALEQITSPVFNPKRKTIVSEQRSSKAEYTTSTYEYINGKAVLIEEVNKKYSDDDYVTITLKKRTKGKMVTVSRTREKAAENYR